MKVLIIATPRSGSTVLCHALAKELRFKAIQEPFNTFIIKYFGNGKPLIDLNKELQDNIVVKSMVHSHTDKDFVSRFDKTILLSRKNRMLAEESWDFQKRHGRKGLGWHSRYVHDGKPVSKKTIESFDYFYDEMAKVSKNLNLPIFWYEDIFSNNEDKINKFIKELDLEINFHTFNRYINTENRYRKIEKTIL